MFGKKDDLPSVQEYFELLEEAKQERDEKGQVMFMPWVFLLIFGIGAACMMLMFV